MLITRHQNIIDNIFDQIRIKASNIDVPDTWTSREMEWLVSDIADQIARKNNCGVYKGKMSTSYKNYKIVAKNIL